MPPSSSTSKPPTWTRRSTGSSRSPSSASTSSAGATADSSTPWSTRDPDSARSLRDPPNHHCDGRRQGANLDRIRSDLEALAHPAIPFAAHNVAFDSAFLKPTVPAWSAPWICTLRVARHLWPDALSHSNQALRYRLDLNVRGDEPPHRAMGDALTTAALLVRQVETAGSVDRLLDLTRQPALLSRASFGKHRGLLWSEVPMDYLNWAVQQSWDDPDVAHTIRSAREGRFPPLSGHNPTRGTNPATGFMIPVFGFHISSSRSGEVPGRMMKEGRKRTVFQSPGCPDFSVSPCRTVPFAGVPTTNPGGESL